MEELIKFQRLREVLEEYAIKLRNKYQDALIENDRIASGDLLNSVEYITHFEDGDYWIGLSLEEYWKYVEYDTKPHMPPVSAILKWIQVKPLLPTPNKDGKLPTPEGLAWAIAKTIEKYGTRGTSDFGETNKELAVEYEEKIKDAIYEDLDNGVYKIMRTLWVDGYEIRRRNREMKF